MSIASEITRIKGKVADSFTACEAKGATIPESEVIANLPTCIDSIPTGSQAVLGTKAITANGTYNAVDDSLDGYSAVTVDVPTGGTVEPTEPKAVNFYDTSQGKPTLVASYTVAEAQTLTELPTAPTHDGLTFQSWNWSLANVNSLTSGMDIGATYVTTDGKTHALIEVLLATGKSFQINVNKADTATMTIDWGDGKNSTINTSGAISTPHTYANYGEYEITLLCGGDYALGCYFGNTNKLFVGGNNVQQLKKLYIGTNVTFINVYAFLGCSSVTSISIPDSVTGTGIYAFQLCSCLNSISIPDGVTSIGANAFSNCYSLTSISIPDGVTSIGANAFSNCYSLASISIPDGVTSIGANAFNNCFSLTKCKIYRTAGVVTLSNTSAFTGINKIAKIYVPDSLLNSYKSATNWVTYKNYIYPLSNIGE